MIPPRTTPALVEGVLMADYDFNESPDLSPFVATASAIVDEVTRCAARKRIVVDPVTLELVERWLAAHMYCCSDQPYARRHTLRASGEFQGETKLGFEGSKYGQTAIRVDFSGCLRNIDKSARMRAVWGGRHPRRGYYAYYNDYGFWSCCGAPNNEACP